MTSHFRCHTVTQIPKVADNYINLDNAWESRRLLEVDQELDNQLLRRLVERGSKSENKDIQDAARNFWTPQRALSPAIQKKNKPMPEFPKTPSEFNPLRTLWKIVGIHGTVNRPFFALTGVGLMLFKYAVEFAVVMSVTGKYFTPLAFMIPSLILRDEIFQGAPTWLPWAMALWSIPFVWIAVTMSCRRAIDIGKTPWMGMLVMIPCINIPSMLFLAISSSSSKYLNLPNEIPLRQPIDSKSAISKISAAALGLLIGGLFSLGLVLLSVYTLHNYGSSLFIGMPIVAGSVSGYVYNQPTIKSVGSSCLVGMLCVLMGEAALLLFALEGVICLAMAAPLMLPLGALGGLLGWFLAKTILLQSRMMIGGVLILFPILNLIEMQFKDYQEVMVESSIVINAPPERVWENVVAFPEINSAQEWYFRLGVAAPLRARIDGNGVGAVRHCEFTTGDFVEPITVWDRPNRLAFNVSEQPDPLIELTPFRSVRPPHLQHSFLSQRGEFELIALGENKTQLIGRTWYTIDMGPRIYWRLWTDQIIHRIHMRVLDHIRKHTEDLPD